MLIFLIIFKLIVTNLLKYAYFELTVIQRRKNLNKTINLSFKNTERDMALYKFIQNKMGKSNYIKEVLEKEMLREVGKEKSPEV